MTTKPITFPNIPFSQITQETYQNPIIHLNKKKMAALTEIPVYQTKIPKRESEKRKGIRYTPGRTSLSLAHKQKES